MAALDTNILVRWLVEDDAQQLAQVRSLFQAVLAGGGTLFVPITVVIELEWVLRSHYQLNKPAFIEVLGRLLNSPELSFHTESTVDLAIVLFTNNTADFADCIHTAIASFAGENPLYTFDQQAAKLTGATLV